MYLSIGQEGVHSLQEGRVEDVGLVHDKHNLLPLAAGATENVTEVVVKVHGRVLPVDLGTRESQTPTSTDTIANVTTTIETEQKIFLKLLYFHIFIRCIYKSQSMKMLMMTTYYSIYRSKFSWTWTFIPEKIMHFNTSVQK